MAVPEGRLEVNRSMIVVPTTSMDVVVSGNPVVVTFLKVFVFCFWDGFFFFMLFVVVVILEMADF